MDCKLDSFVKYLEDSECFEQEVINDVIVKNYSNRDNCEFEITGTTYIVNTFREREALMYDVAKERYYDAISEIKNVIRNNSTFNEFEKELHLTLINFIPEDSGIDVICDLIDYEEEFDCEQVYTDKYYNIYRIN